MTYSLIVALTMFILPGGSILIEWSHHQESLLWLIGKWFVFWAVGIRLLLAGVRQYLRPAFTSRTILGIESPDAFVLVRELGGANLATGVVGVASMAMPTFVLPSAILAGIFYTVAGLEHVKEKHRGMNATVAMVSDLFAAVVLIGYVIGALATGSYQ
ncbi:MAG: hypothetical protein NTAFB05_18880 [Nitrobacter sp.]